MQADRCNFRSIGGHILALLSKDHEFKAKADIHALVRRAEHVNYVQALGFTAVLCDLNDVDELEKQILKLGSPFTSSMNHTRSPDLISSFSCSHYGPPHRL
jgi:hypothetical protein